MKHLNSGATIWARQTIDSDIFFWKPASWFKIWFYIVSQVGFSNSRQFQRGSGLFTLDEIARQTRQTKTIVQKCLKYMVRDNMIDTRKTTRGTIITVRQFSLYQDLKNYKTTPETTEETSAGLNGDNSGVFMIDKNGIYEKNDNTITGGEEKTTLKKEPNPDIEFILRTFKEVFGVIPVDHKPRFVAHNLARRVHTFIKKYGKEGVTFERVIEKGFEYYRQRTGEKADFTSNLSTVGRHMDQFMEKRLSAITNSTQA